jgi:hypothetical protein
MTTTLSLDKSKMHLCRCGKTVLSTLVDGFNTTVNLEPVDIPTEAALILTGRPTFDLIKAGVTTLMWLDYRIPSHVARNGLARRTIVLASHKCGTVR